LAWFRQGQRADPSLRLEERHPPVRQIAGQEDNEGDLGDLSRLKVQSGEHDVDLDPQADPFTVRPRTGNPPVRWEHREQHQPDGGCQRDVAVAAQGVCPDSVHPDEDRYRQRRTDQQPPALQARPHRVDPVDLDEAEHRDQRSRWDQGGRAVGGEPPHSQVHGAEGDSEDEERQRYLGIEGTFPGKVHESDSESCQDGCSDDQGGFGVARHALWFTRRRRRRGP
jgi:hypothetical protein